jgi:hypothetical protein
MDKKQQKKLITEIMNEDSKDGLYKQQTAVDWLIEQINNDAYQIAFGQTYVSIELIEQAKAMEKEQIMKAWDRAYAIGGANGSNDWVYECELTDNSEYYYNETYNNEKDN